MTKDEKLQRLKDMRRRFIMGAADHTGSQAYEMVQEIMTHVVEDHSPDQPDYDRTKPVQLSIARPVFDTWVLLTLIGMEVVDNDY